MFAVLARALRSRDSVRQFTPNWFTATMGTGILAIALERFPWPVPGLRVLAELLWFANIGLYAAFVVLYAARWVLFPGEAARIFGHNVMCMFFGAIPMGLATIVNGLLVFGVPHWGESAIVVATALWWIDVAMALLCAWLVPYLMFSRQDHRLSEMTAVWLVPLVACEVAAASGGLLLASAPQTSSSITILFVSYALWAVSVVPALGVLVILFLRMVLGKIPGPDMSVSCWLSLGPIGSGTLALLLLGQAAPRVLVGSKSGSLAETAHGLGIFGGAMLWGYGIWWLGLAAALTLRQASKRLPFTIGWWGFVFPTGVYAVSTLALADATGLAFYRDLGAALVGLLVCFWLLVSARTVSGIRRGGLFVAPCLSEETGVPTPGDRTVE